MFTHRSKPINRPCHRLHALTPAHWTACMWYTYTHSQETKEPCVLRKALESAQEEIVSPSHYYSQFNTGNRLRKSSEWRAVIEGVLNCAAFVGSKERAKFISASQWIYAYRLIDIFCTPWQFTWLGCTLVILCLCRSLGCFSVGFHSTVSFGFAV